MGWSTLRGPLGRSETVRGTFGEVWDGSGGNAEGA